MSAATTSRTTWRVLRTELLRSTAPAAALATLAAGAGMLYSEATSWAGQWMPFAAAVRSGMFITGTLAVMAGAWQAGRERRRHITEQLDATPRPAWHPVLLSWVGVTLGCWVGLLVAVSAGAGFVAPVATYAGGSWWWLIVVAFVALAALSAAGVALGRLVPFRLTGPVAAIVYYALMIYAHDDAHSIGEAVWLAPIMRIYESVGRTLPASFHMQQIIWFGGLAVAFLVLAGARRRMFVLVPAMVATAGAALLVSGSAQAQSPTMNSKWEPDAAARELVCTEGAPEVCLPRTEAFLLDDVTPYVREVLERFEDVPGGPSRAVNAYGPSTSDDQQLRIETWPTITGDLEPDETWMIVHWQPRLDCGQGVDEGHYRIVELASMWAVGDPWINPEAEEARDALEAMPEADQKAWIGDVIAAAESCDEAALSDLADQLT